MNKTRITVEEKFFNNLSRYMDNGDEFSLKTIYSLFPQMNKKTISWRLYLLVQQGKLYRTGHGFYSLNNKSEDKISADYDYLQNKSKKVYDILSEYGYEFYLSGLDSLVGEILHLPESYPVLIVVEEADIEEIQEILSEREMIALTEKDRDILSKTVFKKRIDAILLKGRDFSFSTDNVSRKEKGFIDLYYAVTRMEYGISVPELSRIYESLQRNNSIRLAKLKAGAKDRGISDEINWLIDIKKASKKTLEFMSYQIKESKWNT